MSDGTDGGVDGGVAPAGPGPNESSEIGDASYGLGTFNAPDNSNSQGGVFNAALDSQLASSLFGYDPASMSVESNNNPAFTMADMPDDSFFGQFGKFANSPFGKGLLGLVSVANPALGSVLGMTSFAANAGKDPGAAFGGKGGSIAGSAIGGPMGGFLGGMLGSSLGQGAFNGTTGTAADASANQGNSFGDWAGLGAGLYAGYQGMRDTGSMLGGLQDLYSQNSPYATAMRQQLERRDAAAGRRSQYGNREVELQAKLAQLASGQIPAMSQLNQQRMQYRNAMLNNALAYGNKLGVFQGLKDMWNAPTITAGDFSPVQSGFFENQDTSGGLGNIFNG